MARARAKAVIEMAAAELIEDSDLYPRTDVDAHHIVALVQALEAGEELPSIVACRETKKVVDGFHRRRAYLRHFGEEARVSVELRDYTTDAERFEDAVRLNSTHGLKLDAQSRTRVTILGERLGLTHQRIACCLRVSETVVERIAVRIVTVNGSKEHVPTKPVIKHLEGGTISPEQREALRSQGGLHFRGSLTQIRKAVEAKLFDANDPLVLNAMHELGKLLLKAVPRPVAIPDVA